MSLDDIQVKLDRAKAHFGAFKAEVDRFAKEKPHPFHVVAYNGNNIYDVVALRDLPPRCSAIIGDCVHNLRCCLDYIVWELAGGAKNAPPFSEFPIFQDETKYLARSKNGKPTRGSGLYKIEGIATSRPRALIYELQPFKAPDPLKHPLWLLHELDNFDKHRALHPTVQWVHRKPGLLGISTTDDLPAGWRQVHATQSPSYPTPTPAGTKVSVKMRHDLALYIAFPTHTSAWTDNVDVILAKLIEYIDSVVINGFAPFL